jgi:hypothetical protein
MTVPRPHTNDCKNAEFGVALLIIMLLKEVLGNGENQIAFRNGNRLAARIDKLRIDMPTHGNL